MPWGIKKQNLRGKKKKKDTWEHTCAKNRSVVFPTCLSKATYVCLEEIQENATYLKCLNFKFCF